ncbi:ATP-dependent helicase DinG, partial [Robertmurraya sp. DFI.2.37]|nr:ATP-dependent helicase DinG [Robertmurraya sp. DFI.2.37]
LGLDKFDCYIQQIESPFPYDKQVQLVIPNDLPEINTVSIDEYVAAITEHIISIAEATKGRMLILFTSYEMLRTTYNLMKESGLLEDYIIMGQGITAGSST